MTIFQQEIDKIILDCINVTAKGYPKNCARNAICTTVPYIFGEPTEKVNTPGYYCTSEIPALVFGLRMTEQPPTKLRERYTCLTHRAGTLDGMAVASGMEAPGAPH